ncbi:hypothetical protein [Bradyrhizobium australiense]|uniref:Uncharacterized protein n=1 Tax=Bradyrhizobium australiense TaxID=2721161 RepID=A0A7Y4GRS1_9BRAD|nr:hypothetical protein [Bradyrhizobium australiense]NOJ40779.1 hypothetical protein [Bradyrhizobium australiense]
MRDFVVGCTVDVVEDRSRKALLGHPAKIVEIVAVFQTHLISRLPMQRAMELSLVIGALEINRQGARSLNRRLRPLRQVTAQSALQTCAARISSEVFGSLPLRA